MSRLLILLAVSVACLFSVGCKSSHQKSLVLTLESPIYDSAPYMEKPLKAKVEYRIDFDRYPNHDWR